jgi:hypothetical protein
MPDLSRRHKPRTKTQLYLLTVFYRWRHRGKRPTRPSLRDLVLELNGSISPRGVLSHLDAMCARGDLIHPGPRAGKTINRPWRLSPQGYKRAKAKVKQLRRAEKRQREKEALRKKREREDELARKKRLKELAAQGRPCNWKR